MADNQTEQEPLLPFDEPDPMDPLTMELSVLPSLSAIQPQQPPHLVPVISGTSLSGLLVRIKKRSGLSLSEIARRMGTVPQAVRPYLNGAVERPSVAWVCKFAEACGARVYMEIPK